MKYLLAESNRLNVTIQCGKLPAGESARYFDGARRIILDPELNEEDAQRALAIALGHAYYGHVTETPHTVENAKHRAQVLLVRATFAILASAAAALSVLMVGTSAVAVPEPMTVAQRHPLSHVRLL